MHVGVVANMKAGLEHFIYRELLYLTQNGLSISLFPTRCNPGLYEPLDSWSVHRWSPYIVALMQPYFFLRSPAKYLRLLAEAIRYSSLVDFSVAWYFSTKMANVDVIYATFGDRKLFIGYFCKRILDKPLAVTMHAYELYVNPNPRLFVRALNASDQLITVSEHNREYLQAHFGIDPSKVEVVRYSLDAEEYRLTPKFVILIVAFFVYRKGHEVLFKAVKKLGRGDIEVWVVGGAGGRRYTVDVESMAREIGMESQVAFFGTLRGSALKAVYRACDVFCLPSRKDRGGAFEGFPNVLIEAMAFGKPVISTRHVEIPRVIPEILVDENDVDQLADAIESVYQSATFRKRLGEQSRAIAETVFSPKTASLLRSLV